MAHNNLRQKNFIVTSFLPVHIKSRCVVIQQDLYTVLHWACKKGHAEVVGVLLAAKATVNTQNKVSLSIDNAYHICTFKVRITAEWSYTATVSCSGRSLKGG